MGEKLFIGPRLRLLRQSRGWKLEACAAQLGLSASYLSQIEANQRPVTARVLIDVMRVFEVDAASLDAADDQRLIADLREATADAPVGGPMGSDPPALSEIKAAVANTPNLAKAYLDLHRAYRRLDERLKATEEAVSLDERGAASALLPYEEVRDFFHYKNNYIHSLDVAAETLATEIGGGGERALEAYLADRLGVRVVRGDEPDLLRHWDAASRTVTIGAAHPEATRSFQLAYQIAALTLPDIVEAELSAAGFRSDSAAKVCRTGLLNYAAGALVLPYERFREAARAARHDIERLALSFQTSLEQVFHRLSTLQRPGARGVPFYFVRLDRAGNITKRHSATRLQFARFGGACPLWNVHDAFARPDAWLVQLAQMPDAVRYVCIARGVVKPSGAYRQAERRYALGLGCEAAYADQLVYADGLDLAGPSAPIGVSCRICERDDCSQRAFPPVDRAFEVFEDDRRWVPFSLRP